MSTSRTIWRTVVVAGAMLGAPMVAYADAPPPAKSAPPSKDAPVDKASEPPADKAAPGKNPVDKAPAEKVPPSQDPARGSGAPVPTKPIDKKAPKPTPRTRATGDRPLGRGFVLA